MVSVICRLVPLALVRACSVNVHPTSLVTRLRQSLYTYYPHTEKDLMFSALPFNGRQEERYLFIVSDRTTNVLPPAEYRPVITQHSYCFISRHEFLTSSYTYRQLRTLFSLRMFALGGVLERLVPEDKKLSHSYYTASTEKSYNHNQHPILGRSFPRPSSAIRQDGREK